jgi:outer membrane protein OmpA-like peptidoglycan-associated protein
MRSARDTGGMNLLELAIGRGTVLVVALAIASGLARPASSPPRGRVVVTDTETTILDVVEFAPATSILQPSSRPTLDAVAATLRGNPSIELIEVQSHTSGIGDGDANLALTQQRAEVVVSYLGDAGIAPTRLVAQGYGDTQPIDRAAPTKNERVSFLIVRRSTDLGAR